MEYLFYLIILIILSALAKGSSHLPKLKGVMTKQVWRDFLEKHDAQTRGTAHHVVLSGCPTILHMRNDRYIAEVKLDAAPRDADWEMTYLRNDVLATRMFQDSAMTMANLLMFSPPAREHLAHMTKLTTFEPLVWVRQGRLHVSVRASREAESDGVKEPKITDRLRDTELERFLDVLEGLARVHSSLEATSISEALLARLSEELDPTWRLRILRAIFRESPEETRQDVLHRALESADKPTREFGYVYTLSPDAIARWEQEGSTKREYALIRGLEATYLEDQEERSRWLIETYEMLGVLPFENLNLREDVRVQMLALSFAIDAQAAQERLETLLLQSSTSGLQRQFFLRELGRLGRHISVDTLTALASRCSRLEHQDLLRTLVRLASPKLTNELRKVLDASQSQPTLTCTALYLKAFPEHASLAVIGRKLSEDAILEGRQAAEPILRAAYDAIHAALGASPSTGGLTLSSGQETQDGELTEVSSLGALSMSDSHESG